MNCTVQCTVYTETTKNDFVESHQLHTKSHQLRTKTYAVTSTLYHDFTQSHKLRTMNERRHTNECRPRQVTVIQFNQKIFWANWVHSWYRVGVTAFIHGTELLRFGKGTLRSTKISTQWLWPVKVTLKVIKWCPKAFCLSCDEGPLN